MSWLASLGQIAMSVLPTVLPKVMEVLGTKASSAVETLGNKTTGIAGETLGSIVKLVGNAYVTAGKKEALNYSRTMLNTPSAPEYPTQNSSLLEQQQYQASELEEVNEDLSNKPKTPVPNLKNVRTGSFVPSGKKRRKNR